MELVEGVPLNEYTDRHNLDVRGRLELIAQLCDMMQHAHQVGMVPRDLNSVNILVTSKETTTSIDACRDGSYNGARDSARSAIRSEDAHAHTMNALGVRPARTID